VCVLASAHQVITCLVTYTDWWQPSTTSVLQVRRTERRERSEGFQAEVLDTLDERAELCRRMQHLEERDRHLLYLWYVEQAAVEDIARSARLSRRQCFRRRARAVGRLVDIGRRKETPTGTAA
jgi:DNA-directed RNA polymerase specialized sigma subunit